MNVFAARPGLAMAGVLACLVASSLVAQPVAPSTALVEHVLKTELQQAQSITNLSAPLLRYQLRKQTANLTQTRLIIETRDGAVARQIAEFDHPLSPADQAADDARLNQLLADPARQRHRKQNEDSDASLVLKLLRMLPQAFQYQYDGQEGGYQRYSFRPTPGFEPPDMESQALTSLNGTLVLDPVAGRIVRLEGHLTADTSYGWGMLGKLDRGGWVVLEQAEVLPHQWRIIHLRLRMNLRILFKNKIIDTDERMTGYQPAPPAIDYRQAIQLLRSGR